MSKHAVSMNKVSFSGLSALLKGISEVVIKVEGSFSFRHPAYFSLPEATAAANAAKPCRWNERPGGVSAQTQQ